jgi:hypothetical protein
LEDEGGGDGLMDAVRARARALLRANVTASVALAVIAGLGAGLALGAWAAARRGSGSYERFLDHLAGAEGSFGVCADDPTEACTSAALSDLRSLPEVATAVRMAAVMVRYELPSGQVIDGGLEVTIDEGFPTPVGEPIVVAGRLLDPAADDEVLVPDNVAMGLKVGSTVALTPYRGLFSDAGPELRTDARHTVRLVGIIRTPASLVVSTGTPERDEATPYAGPRWWARHADEVSPWGYAVLTRARPGVSLDELDAAVRERLGERITDLEVTGRPVEETVVDAIGFESSALLAFALVTALAVIVFVGQALVRQARREAVDQQVLVALGASRRQLVAGASLRAAPVAVAAALLASVVAFLSSVVTPVGVARLAEPARGLWFDPWVTVVGGAAVVLLVLLCLSVPALAVHRHVRSSGRSRAVSAAAGRLGLPDVAVAGAGVVLPGRQGGLAARTAVVGFAAVVAVAVAAAGVSASLADLRDHPANYGAVWDAEVGGIADENGTARVLEVLLPSDDVAAVAERLGTDARVGDEPTVVMAFDRHRGDPEPPWFDLVRGREPLLPGEAAVGPTIADRMGVDLGDDLVVQLEDGGGLRDETVRVVGIAVTHVGDDIGAGEGVVVPPAWLRDRVVGWSEPVVRFASGADPAELERALGSEWLTLDRPLPQASVRNLVRVDWLPWLLFAAVAALGIAAMLHALVITIRRQRGQLAVLRAVGFTRVQTGSAVCWAASMLAAIALVVGLPAGAVLARWGWRWLSGTAGVVVAPVVPLAAVVVIAAGAMLLANVLAVVPGWRASRVPTAEALRAE